MSDTTTQASRRSIPAPNRLFTLMESRATSEFAQWRLSKPILDRLPAGDGQPVLVLPGFTADDRSTFELRRLLRRIGYRTYGWKLGSNVGPTKRIAAGLDERLLDVAGKEGRPVTIVGWSLGGIFARHLGRSHPEFVRQVITLGSPIRMQPGDPSAATAMWDSLSRFHDDIKVAEYFSQDQPTLPVPTSAVFTRTDGVVHWRHCRTAKAENAENIEVWGSHCGLGFNPSVALIVADRLAQDEGEWTPFRPPLWALGAFPPQRWPVGPVRHT